jgi:hypothetical protein
MPTGNNRWGTVPWGTSPPAAGSGQTLDVLAAYNDVWYRLGFGTQNEISSTSWVTAAELFQSADEAAKKLSYDAGVFITYDNSVSVVAGTAVYNLPATHVFTIAAVVIDAGTGAIRPLRITRVADLFALDATWQATTGTPARASMDAGAVGTVTLYPQPIANGTFGQICQEFPAAVTQQTSTLALPTVLQDYFSYIMLAAARGKESEAAMPEMAAHFRERVKLYEQLIEHLWGPGQ